MGLDGAGNSPRAHAAVLIFQPGIALNRLRMKVRERRFQIGVAFGSDDFDLSVLIARL